ncbi:hypothetical protein CVT25_009946 [Psilocybe cyanescens]|uniref:Purine-cytosine permease n=1 Tax=Psilocybe cyanescens TaxID=93625 RepID=A0A409XCU4_PSICY|nr:hypothetical protein CVT25_009946 [Psilocybe cyanescens]
MTMEQDKDLVYNSSLPEKDAGLERGNTRHPMTVTAKEPTPSSKQDSESGPDSRFLKGDSVIDESANIDDSKQSGLFYRLSVLLLKWGVETEGVTPIPEEQRTDTRTYQMFWLWFSVNFNILAFSTGSAGPAFFGLGLSNSLLILLVVDVITCAVPAYFAVFGPKLGMRGMVQSRFSWGLYGAVIPSTLNVISTLGFLILNCIIGGQILAAASNKLNDTLGIVIISVISLAVTFFGYRVMHWFESFAWVPAVITFPILLGVANSHLNPSSMPAVPAPSASMVLSFASFVASSIISWCTITPDYGVYHDNKVSTLKIFLYSYFGFLLPSITWHMMGAAFAAAAPGIPSWKSGYDEGNDLGGLLSAVLSPAGGFSKFLLVLIAFGTSCAAAPTMYTFGTSFMAITPAFTRVPRYVFAIISEVILIPLAIIGAKKFYSTLVDILSVIGYWSTSFGAIVLIEHFLFRSSFKAYDIARWDKARLLPPGIAAIFAFLGSFGIIIPSMQQTWYTGPIAKAGTGDIAKLLTSDYTTRNLRIMGAHDDEKDMNSSSKPEMLELGPLDDQSLKADSITNPSTNINEVKQGAFQRFTLALLKLGVETEGSKPIPLEQRTDTRIYQMFWIWFSVNFNILGFTTGSAGPAFFGLGLEPSLLVILVINTIVCAVPAYCAVFGPKLGMRGMVQCRFSWGLYGAIIPSVLNVISMQGFLILNCIIGGQILAAASNGRLDDTLGIVIISIISLAVCFCGYRVMHWFESVAWVPAAIALPILLGLGNKHLNPANMPSVPTPSVAMIMSFATFVASSAIAWCTVTPDYGVYHDAKTSSLKIFLHVYSGYLSSTIAWNMVGAAFAAAAPGVPSWQSGYDEGRSLGGLLSAVLSPTGGFGKFLLVLIAFNTSCAAAPTMYSFGTSFLAITPALTRVPRYVFVIVSEIILIPLAIIGAKKFYSTIVNVLSIIGYWATAFGAIVLVEHFIFRRASFQAYDVARWDQGRLLPPGIAAVTAFLGAFGIIIPCMQQTWFTGPIAKAGTGDIGVFVAAAATVILYTPLRAVERRLWPGR